MDSLGYNSILEATEAYEPNPLVPKISVVH